MTTPAPTLRRRDRGFTLIELMVVVLIIGILIGIAVPTFLGARKRAQNRAAQVHLRNALTAQLTYYADDVKFTTDPTLLAAVQGVIYWQPTAPADARLNQVAVGVAGVNELARVWLESRSATGTEFCLADLAGRGIFYKTAAGCFADPTTDPVSTGWNTSGFE